MLVAFLITASFVRAIPRDLIILVRGRAALLLIGAGILMWIVMRKQHAHAALSESRWSDLRLSLTFASAGVERIIDGAWMLVAFLITASFVRAIPRDLIILVRGLAALLLIGAGILMWIVMRKQHAHAAPTERRWTEILRDILEGLHLMGN